MREDIDKITNKLMVCNVVSDMMETDGWKTIVAPRFKEMIAHESGAELSNGMYSYGNLTGQPNEYEMAKHVGIRQGLVMAYNMIVGHKAEQTRLRKIIDNRKVDDAKPEPGPMDNSRYSLE